VSQIEITADDEYGGADLLPEEVRRLIMTEMSVSPTIAGRAFGLGISSSYRAVRSGEIPSKRLGSKFAVPTSWIRQQLGLEPAPPPQTLQVQVIPSSPPPSKQVAPPRRKRRRHSG
jgi:hypothetical protein